MKNLVEGINLSLYAFSESEKNFQDDLITDPLTPFYPDGSNLTITFLSLNRSALSVRLLDSIQIHLPDFKGKILIVDNGSEAEELDKLKAFVSGMRLPVEIYEANENLGVAGGRNKTAELIKTEWFLSLDNDVYFIDNPLGAIKECIDKLGVHFLNLPLLNSDGHTVFSVGGNLSLNEYKDSYAIGCPTTFRQGLKSEINLEHPFLSTCLYGTAAVLRTKSFIGQGGFDANMLIGFEDLDFSIKLYKEGLKIGNLNTFCAIHGHDAPLNASDVNYEKKRFSQKILRQSAEYFHSKHNIYAWTEGVSDWIAARERELELTNDDYDFAQQTEIHHENKLKHFNLKESGGLPRVALVVDIENWALHNSAQKVVEHLSDSYEFQVFSVSAYETLGDLMLDIKDYDLIHFFWRQNLFDVLSERTRRQFADRGWDYEDFVANVVAKASITFSVWDHLFLDEAEIEERDVLFNTLAVGYIVISEKLNKFYTSVPGYNPPNGLVEMGIDLDSFGPHDLERLTDTEKEIVVGWSGNSKWGGEGIDHKGLETIIKPAVEALRAEGYRVRGFYADRAERWIPYAEMNDYYNSIDIFVCASETEGIPFPVLEAMACGLPIVSTDVGIVPEAFGPLQRKYILPSRTTEDLKSRLKVLIENPRERAALSGENLKEIKRWTWENSCAKWDEFFKSMLSTAQDESFREARDYFKKQTLKMFLRLDSKQEIIKNLENRNAELQTTARNLENRNAELEGWTAELQDLLQRSQNRVSELDQWTVELQAALKNSENYVSELSKLIKDLQTNLQRANEETELARQEVGRLQAEVEQQKLEIELKLEELATARALIARMEASRFWKLRNQWVKLKDTLPGNREQQ